MITMQFLRMFAGAVIETIRQLERVGRFGVFFPAFEIVTDLLFKRGVASSSSNAVAPRGVYAP